RQRSGADHARDEDGRDRQLGRSECESLAGKRLVHAVHFIENLARLDLGDVVLDVPLAVAHADLGRLLRDRLVREDADPDAAAALDVARHRAARRLDLARREAPTAGRLEPEVAERHRSAARGDALVAALLFFPVLASSGLQHRSLLGQGGEARSVALLLTLGRGSGHLAHALDGGLRTFGRLFRRLVRGSRLAIGAATRTARTGTAGAAGRAPRAAVFPVGRGHRFLVGTERGLVAAQRVALVDPHLHADDAVCGERLRGAVVDV